MGAGAQPGAMLRRRRKVLCPPDTRRKLVPTVAALEFEEDFLERRRKIQRKIQTQPGPGYLVLTALLKSHNSWLVFRG